MTVEELRKRNVELLKSKDKLEDIAYKKEEEKYHLLAKQVEVLVPQIVDMLNLWLEVMDYKKIEVYDGIAFNAAHRDYFQVRGKARWVSICLNTCKFDLDTAKANCSPDEHKPYYEDINVALQYFLDHFDEARNEALRLINNRLDYNEKEMKTNFSDRLSVTEIADCLK